MAGLHPPDRRAKNSRYVLPQVVGASFPSVGWRTSTLIEGAILPGAWATVVPLRTGSKRARNSPNHRKGPPEPGTSGPALWRVRERTSEERVTLLPVMKAGISDKPSNAPTRRGPLAIAQRFSSRRFRNRSNLATRKTTYLTRNRKASSTDRRGGDTVASLRCELPSNPTSSDRIGPMPQTPESCHHG